MCARARVCVCVWGGGSKFFTQHPKPIFKYCPPLLQYSCNLQAEDPRAAKQIVFTMALFCGTVRFTLATVHTLRNHTPLCVSVVPRLQLSPSAILFVKHWKCCPALVGGCLQWRGAGAGAEQRDDMEPRGAQGLVSFGSDVAVFPVYL